MFEIICLVILEAHVLFFSDYSPKNANISVFMQISSYLDTDTDIDKNIVNNKYSDSSFREGKELLQNASIKHYNSMHFNEENNIFNDIIKGVYHPQVASKVIIHNSIKDSSGVKINDLDYIGQYNDIHDKNFSPKFFKIKHFYIDNYNLKDNMSGEVMLEFIDQEDSYEFSHSSDSIFENIEVDPVELIEQQNQKNKIIDDVKYEVQFDLIKAFKTTHDAYSIIYRNHKMYEITMSRLLNSGSDYNFFVQFENYVIEESTLVDHKGKVLDTVGKLMKFFYSLNLKKDNDCFLLFDFLERSLDLKEKEDKAKAAEQIGEIVFSLKRGVVTFSQIINLIVEIK